MFEALEFLLSGVLFGSARLVDLPKYAANPKGYEILTWLVSIIATLLIIWYAYKWPKET